MKKLVVFFVRILPFLYMGVIWMLSSLPHNAVIELPMSTIDRYVKESLHLVEFAILYLLFVLAFLTTDKFSLRVSFWCAVVASLYGIIDEIHQYFVPYRSATFIDVVKDIVGVYVASYFVNRAYRKNKLIKIKKWLSGRNETEDEKEGRP